jgi:hypothetical protein
MPRDYVIELTPPTPEDTRNDRQLATVLPEDALAPAMLIAAIVCAGKKRSRCVVRPAHNRFRTVWKRGTGLADSDPLIESRRVQHVRSRLNIINKLPTTTPARKPYELVLKRRELAYTGSIGTAHLWHTGHTCRFENHEA